MKKISLLCLLSFLTTVCSAQQYALYNSRTLFDTFENPSQRAFQIDTSRRYAFNFFIPNISVNTTFTGPAQESFRRLAIDGEVTSDVPFGGKDNSLHVGFRAFRKEREGSVQIHLIGDLWLLD